MGLTLIKPESEGGMDGIDLPTYTNDAETPPEDPQPGESWKVGPYLLFWSGTSWGSGGYATSGDPDSDGFGVYGFENVGGEWVWEAVLFQPSGSGDPKRIRWASLGLIDGSDDSAVLDWFDGDPATGGGRTASIGSLLLRSGSGTPRGPWIKTGAADTDWFDLSSLA